MRCSHSNVFVTGRTWGQGHLGGSNMRRPGNNLLQTRIYLTAQYFWLKSKRFVRRPDMCFAGGSISSSVIEISRHGWLPENVSTRIQICSTRFKSQHTINSHALIIFLSPRRTKKWNKSALFFRKSTHLCAECDETINVWCVPESQADNRIFPLDRRP